MKSRTILRAQPSLRFARFSATSPHRKKKLLPFSGFFGLATLCALFSLAGCYDFNPYLGATPTVSSSITSITPSGANAPAAQDILLTVNGLGFVPGSTVTWNASNSTSINLASNALSSSQVQANIPASLLTTPGTFFVGVIAPGPTTGNNAGNNISNFVPFIVCPTSGCSSPALMPTLSPKLAGSEAVSSASAAMPMAPRYQPVVADSTNASVESGTAIPGIFLRDTCVGATAACVPQIIPVSFAWNGAEPNGPSASPSVTTNGRFVVFSSGANNLVKGDANGWSDIFLRDTCIAATSPCMPTTVRISVGIDGVEANGPSSSPAISPDGRFVIFNSSATNLVRRDSLNSVALPSAVASFLRDTCFGAPYGCVPTTSIVIPASALQR